MPEAVVALGAQAVRVGLLRYTKEAGREFSAFAYDDGWLQDPSRFALSPQLPLQRAPFHFRGARGLEPFPSCFLDAAPDSWGRALLGRVFGAGCSAFDLLTGSDDFTRQGALRFLDDNLKPLSQLKPKVPRLIELDELRRSIRDFERDQSSEEKLKELAGAAGSLGGARPKANVVDEEGNLWIAKFTALQDRGRPIERVEVAVAELASRCGLRVPDSRLELATTGSPVALFRRFDRKRSARVPYISARTALALEGRAMGAYTEIAEFLTVHGARPQQDREELFRRVLFTILVTNTDDHLRNHGFLYEGRGRWGLAPAFDINPAPGRRPLLQTAIAPEHPAEPSLELALAHADAFGLERGEAEKMAGEVGATIARSWRQLLRKHGCSKAEVAGYEEAFEHGASEAARRLARSPERRRDPTDHSL